MNEYETDPRRPPADTAAEQPPHLAEPSPAAPGQSGSDLSGDAANPWRPGNDRGQSASAQPGPADSAAPASPAAASPTGPANPAASASPAGQPHHPGWSGQAGWSGQSGAPGHWSGQPNQPGRSAHPGSWSGHPGWSGQPGQPGGYASHGSAGGWSGPGYAGATGGYPTSAPTSGYPGAPTSGYPGAQPASAVPGGQPGYGGPQPPWGAAHGAPSAPGGAGRAVRALIIGVAALVLMAGSGIAGGIIATALDSDSPTVNRTYSAAPVINSADLPGIAAAVQDSVVSISTSSSEGSGVVLSADGFVLTNNHVVASAQGNAVRVIFANGKSVDARVIGTDPPTDLAVLKADGVADLTPAKLGDSDAMRVGDTVLALGSPLGLQGSVTAGIISARDRTIRSGGQEGSAPRQGASSISGLFQTDAPINPGNSGGALVNTRGEVIGINTAILTAGQGSGNIGVGFAIPSNKAKAVSEALRRGEKVRHPYLGVSVVNAEGGGAVVGSVTPGSPADKIGLRQGDVVTRLGDREIADSSDLVAAVQAGKVGDRLEVIYQRNGSENRATVTLAEAS